MEGRRAAIIWATRRSVLTLEEAEKALEASSDWLNWLEEEEEDELACWLALLLACCWLRARAAWLCASASVACSLAASARLTAWVMEGVSTLIIWLTRIASSLSDTCWITRNPFWPPVVELDETSAEACWEACWEATRLELEELVDELLEDEDVASWL